MTWRRRYRVWDGLRVEGYQEHPRSLGCSGGFVDPSLFAICSYEFQGLIRPVLMPWGPRPRRRLGGSGTQLLLHLFKS